MKNPLIHSKRIYFRPLELDDIEKGWQEWINNEKINKFLDGVYPLSREKMIKYFKENQPPTSILFAICDKANDTYLGNAKLGSIDWINKKCSYGRLIGLENYLHKGYGTETLFLLAKYGFLKLGLNRMYTGVIEANTASIKSNIKVGFVKEGVEKKSIYRYGKYYDVISFGMIRKDFEKKYGKDI